MTGEVVAASSCGGQGCDPLLVVTPVLLLLELRAARDWRKGKAPRLHAEGSPQLLLVKELHAYNAHKLNDNFSGVTGLRLQVTSP